MNKLTILQQGESLPFNFDRGDNSISGWICTISVMEKAGDTPLIQRVIPELNGSWPGFITQTESAALPVLAKGATYMLVASLVNVTTDEEEVIPVRFKISKAWV